MSCLKVICWALIFIFNLYSIKFNKQKNNRERRSLIQLCHRQIWTTADMRSLYSVFRSSNSTLCELYRKLFKFIFIQLGFSWTRKFNKEKIYKKTERLLYQEAKAFEFNKSQTRKNIPYYSIQTSDHKWGSFCNTPYFWCSYTSQEDGGARAGVDVAHPRLHGTVNYRVLVKVERVHPQMW
jgi:hypothetical protein